MFIDLGVAQKYKKSAGIFCIMRTDQTSIPFIFYISTKRIQIILGNPDKYVSANLLKLRQGKKQRLVLSND